MSQTRPVRWQWGRWQPGRWRWARWVAIGLAAIFTFATVLLITRADLPLTARYPDSLGWEERTSPRLVFDRRYVVGTPRSSGAGSAGVGSPAPEPMPAIVLLPGVFTDRGDMSQATSIPGLAAEARAVVAIPQGLWGTWNAGDCCLPTRAFGVDDVGFIDEVVADLADDPNVDPDKIYVVGLSNGAMMAYHYACNRSEEIAGVAGVAGAVFDAAGCEDRAVPVVMMNTTADPVVPLEGGMNRAALIKPGPFPDAFDGAESMAVAMGCGTDIDVGAIENSVGIDIEATTWTDCPGGDVRFITVESSVHNWLYSDDWTSTDEIAAFFDLSP